MTLKPQASSLKPNAISPDRRAKGLYWSLFARWVDGCTPVSEACEHCWSSRPIMGRAAAMTWGGKWTGKVRFREDRLSIPLHVKKPQVWMVLNDLFHEDVDFRFAAAAFGVMECAFTHTFLVLTKRVERLAEFDKWAIETATKERYLCLREGLFAEAAKERGIILDYGPVTAYGKSLRPDYYGKFDIGPLVPTPNIAIGTTVESPDYMWRAQRLCEIPAAVRFLSMEPLLGPVKDLPLFDEDGLELACIGPDGEDMRSCERCGGEGFLEYAEADETWGEDCPSEENHLVTCPACRGTGIDPWYYRRRRDFQHIHAVVVGCESGPNARETKLEWVRDIRDQCQAAGVDLWVKQLQVNGKFCNRLEQFPEDVRIRKLPWVKGDKT